MEATYDLYEQVYNNLFDIDSHVFNNGSSYPCP
jgi:hypothetical protein